jgi:hypothetical protein
MREFGNIESFIEHLGELAIAETLAARHALSNCAKVVEKRAKDKFGEYQQQAGPFIAWAELADFTKADREKQGYPENEPLLRTGAARDSIGHALSTESLEAQIGSNSDILVYQELGTKNMPPRSTLGGAMVESLPKIQEILERSLIGVLIGNGPTAALVGEEVVEGGIAIGN